MLPGEEIRAKLRALFECAPPGAKRPIARALGFRGRWALHSLRSLVKGKAKLYDGVRVRLTRLLGEFERGELVLVPTGAQGPGKRLYRVVARGPVSSPPAA